MTDSEAARVPTFDSETATGPESRARAGSEPVTGPGPGHGLGDRDSQSLIISGPSIRVRVSFFVTETRAEPAWQGPVCCGLSGWHGAWLRRLDLEPAQEVELDFTVTEACHGCGCDSTSPTYGPLIQISVADSRFPTFV
jgi:hypothetical protein